MADIAGAFGASKSASTLLVLFIPSRDRNDRAIGFPLEDKPPSRRQKGRKGRGKLEMIA